MQTLTQDKVDEAVDQIYDLQDDDAVEGLVDQIGEMQPLIFTFLMTMGEDDFHEEERELFLFLGVMVWIIMSYGKAPLAEITEEQIDQSEQENMPLLESITGDTEKQFIQYIPDILDGYNQPHILQYIFDSVLDEEEEGVREINQPIMVIFLKIVIDCFDKLTDQ